MFLKWNIVKLACNKMYDFLTGQCKVSALTISAEAIQGWTRAKWWCFIASGQCIMGSGQWDCYLAWVIYSVE